MKFRPFAEARDYVRTLNLKNAREWEEYCKTGNKPSDIPSNPSRTYISEWNGYGDWLGTGTARPNRTIQISYRPFDKAREYVRKLGLKSVTDWKGFCRSGNRPQDVPSNPNIAYRDEWKGWGNWLGTFRIADQYKKYRPFEEAREYVRKLGLKDAKKGWRQYCKSGNKPDDIPSHPDGTYEKEWKGWGNWLGTGTIASFNREYRSFAEARKFVHKLKLKNSDEWGEYAKSDRKPSDIPADPS